eukprot:CCRYP_019247-RA/>CCRYP_019247-RA protein AED:0.13 eAED:0.13 QI:481/1/1/1/1/1/5/149/1185
MPKATTSKSVSEVEWAEEVKASERIKGRKASARDAKAKQSNNATGNNGTNKNSASKKAKKPIKRLREQRRQLSAQLAQLAEQEEHKRKSRKIDAGIENHPGNIIAAAQNDILQATASGGAEISDFYWEVETVVGRRIHRGRVEYLIRWKGCSEEENTWEPAANLCDTAMEEAMKYVKAQKLKEKKREEDEKKLFGEDENEEKEAKSIITTKSSGNGLKENGFAAEEIEEDAEMEGHGMEEEVLEDDLWDWTDQDQVIFNPVQRINIHDPTAPSIVKDARINGTPIVLVGHVGWANFAKRWISKKDSAVASVAGVDAKSHAGKQEIGLVVDQENEDKTCKNINGAGKIGPNFDVEISDGSLNAAKTAETASSAGTCANDTSGETQSAETNHTTSPFGDLGGLDGKQCHGINDTSNSGVNTQSTASKDESSFVVCTGVKLNGNAPVSSISDECKANVDAIAESTALRPKADDIMRDTTKNHVTDATNVRNCAVPEDGVKESSIEAAIESDAISINRENAVTSDEIDGSLLDLSKRDFYLDINKMIDDIGDEDVPVIKRNYNEEKPIHGNIRAAKFLTNCWPNANSDVEAVEHQKKSPKLYLHQWQFPLSDTAGRKLCHKNMPLPKSIMGEDLLKYWLDLPQCKLDSPLQYIFMGREDTLSKLHNDPGGLDISIAPIVGEKECVLVHRADGPNCLYHLQASLNDIDLHKYPLMSQARIWRTTIQPGEILLMPHGTYHQCRNVTPCLSYSRFHLDTVNLLPFAQSLVNGDAPEIDHEEILWNLTSELISKVDEVFDAAQLRLKKGDSATEDLSDDVIETVNILRTLRHFVREVARRHEIRRRLKGDDSRSEHCFSTLVDDVDMCLHEFRFRKNKVIPPFKARQGKALKNTIAKGGRKDVIKTDLSKFEIEGKPVVAFNTLLEVNYMSLRGADVDKLYPRASRERTGEKLIKELSVGDLVNVKLEQKVVKAEVLEVVPEMHSAYLSFEDYPSVYDEWQPTSLLRLPTRAEISPEDIKPGLVVIDLSNRNEYRATVMSIVNGPMAKMRLFVSQHVMTRWVSPGMILGKYDPPKKLLKPSRKEPAVSTEEVETKTDVEPCRPTTGQVVEVYRKGAAWVTKCHYEIDGVEQKETFPTYVDVRYILGQSTEEKNVPITLVRLAPELDPNSGRSKRQACGSKSDEGSVSVESGDF